MTEGEFGDDNACRIARPERGVISRYGTMMMRFLIAEGSNGLMTSMYSTSPLVIKSPVGMQHQSPCSITHLAGVWPALQHLWGSFASCAHKSAAALRLVWYANSPCFPLNSTLIINLPVVLLSLLNRQSFVIIQLSLTHFPEHLECLHAGCAFSIVPREKCPLTETETL